MADYDRYRYDVLVDDVWSDVISIFSKKKNILIKLDHLLYILIKKKKKKSYSYNDNNRYKAKIYSHIMRVHLYI